MSALIPMLLRKIVSMALIMFTVIILTNILSMSKTKTRH
jgi:hypothetical protein